MVFLGTALISISTGWPFTNLNKSMLGVGFEPTTPSRGPDLKSGALTTRPT